MDGISEHLIKAIVASISDIPLIELNTIYLALTLGNDVKQVNGYDKVKFLFTENDGAKMNRDTETIFKAYVESLLRNR